MALIHEAELRPSKIDLLNAWVPTRPWSGGVPVERLGAYRFDDPAGEVGVECFLLSAGARVLHVPITYRGAPLAGAEEHLIGTMEHSVLGSRWMYDGCADPVWATATVAAILTGGRHAELYKEVNGSLQSLGSPMQVAGSGTAGTPVDQVLSARPRDDGPATLVAAGPYEVRVARVVGAPIGGDLTLTGTWDGGGPATLASLS